MRKLVVLLFLSTLSTQGWAREKSAEELKHKESHLSHQGDEAYKAGDCKKSLKLNLESIELTDQIREFGGTRGYGYQPLEAANCYAEAGDTENAIKYYLLTTNAVPANASGIAAKLGQNIAPCPVCSYSLIYWDSLAHVYQLMGDTDKAARAKAELTLHTEANEAYRKAEKKGSGLHFLDYVGIATAGVGAVGTARTGAPALDVSDIHSDTEAEMQKATNRAWYAKMIVYKKANRPEYVAQVVQEMRNYQNAR